MITTLVLVLAGLGAGALNAIAGGGTFLTFPALVWAGVPPIAANATATLSALPGYASSAYAYRNDMAAEGPLGLRALVLLAAAGGLAGSLLLLVTPPEAFVALVPWLLGIATLLFAAGPRIVRVLVRTGSTPGRPATIAIIGAVTVYGGYFNGGLGILLLAAFGLTGYRNLHGMNGMKSLLSFLLSVVSALAYAAAGLIAWGPAAVLAAATLTGGYVGARMARRLGDTVALRAVITGIGATMTLAFALR